MTYCTPVVTLLAHLCEHLYELTSYVHRNSQVKQQVKSSKMAQKVFKCLLEPFSLPLHPGVTFKRQIKQWWHSKSVRDWIIKREWKGSEPKITGLKVDIAATTSRHSMWISSVNFHLQDHQTPSDWSTARGHHIKWQERKTDGFQEVGLGVAFAKGLSSPPYNCKQFLFLCVV